MNGGCVVRVHGPLEMRVAAASVFPRVYILRALAAARATSLRPHASPRVAGECTRFSTARDGEQQRANVVCKAVARNAESLHRVS